MICWKAFQVDLKACLGLVLPTQLCPTVVWMLFWATLFCGPCLLLCVALYDRVVTLNAEFYAPLSYHVINII